MNGMQKMNTMKIKLNLEKNPSSSVHLHSRTISLNPAMLVCVCIMQRIYVLGLSIINFHILICMYVCMYVFMYLFNFNSYQKLEISGSWTTLKASSETWTPIEIMEEFLRHSFPREC